MFFLGRFILRVRSFCTLRHVVDDLRVRDDYCAAADCREGDAMMSSSMLDVVVSVVVGVVIVVAHQGQ